mgnify:CR=1 FL=1|jgi:hypothetical protein
MLKWVRYKSPNNIRLAKVKRLIAFKIVFISFNKWSVLSEMPLVLKWLDLPFLVHRFLWEDCKVLAYYF